MLRSKTKKIIEDCVGPLYFGLAMAIPFVITANQTLGSILIAIALAPIVFAYFYRLINKFGGEK